MVDLTKQAVDKVWKAALQVIVGIPVVLYANYLFGTSWHISRRQAASCLFVVATAVFLGAIIF